MRIRAAFRTRRGSIFLFTMIALFVLMMLGVSLLEISINGLARASRDQKRAEALALAESGVDMVLAKMYDNYDGINEQLDLNHTYSTTYSLPQGNVSCTVTSPFQGIPQTAEVRATATSWRNRSETVRVVAYYATDVSRVFKGAIFSDNRLDIKGTVNILPDPTGEGAQIYAHGDIIIDGGSLTFDDGAGPLPDGKGGIYCTGDVVDKQGNEVQIAGVDPANIHTGVAPFPMPVIDLNYYRLHATRTIIAPKSGYTFKSTDLQNISGIIFVQGNCSISGQYTGSAVIVATGTISVTGSGLTAANQTSSVGLLTPMAVKLAGGATVDGLVYAHSVDASVTASGSATIHGAIAADVVNTVNGTVTIQYSDCFPGLDVPGKGRSQWMGVSWEELFI